MSKRKVLVSVGAVIILVLASGAAYFLGDKHGVMSMNVQRATPHQLAEAMKGDYFYANYEENTLLVNGTVSAVSRSGNTTTVGFVSSSSYHTQCSFATSPPNVKVGNKLAVITEGASAVRDSNGVTLEKCLQP